MNLENKKQIAIILLAVGLGLVAAVATGKYIETSVAERAQAYKKEFEKNFEKKAMAPLIGEMQNLKKELIRVKQEQKTLAERQRNQSKRLAKASLGRLAPAGDTSKPLSQRQIVDSTVFSVITPPGKRAVTININTLAAVGGLINPGDFVDVIAQLRMPSDEGPEEVTTVLFQNIQVLAIGTNFKPIGNALTYQAQQQARTLIVTLALSPEEAGLMMFAKSNGRINLSLRSPEERGKQVLQVASWDTLAEYILENQGTQLFVPQRSEEPPTIKSNDQKEEPKRRPATQIFIGGREL